MVIKETFDENDKLHSFNDEPAYVEGDFTQLWYNHGLQHREKDLPAKILKNGEILEWKLNGLRHRENGLPALVKNGEPVFYGIFGKGHRLEGPAYMELPNWRFLYAQPLQITEHKNILKEHKETGLSLPLLILGRVYHIDTKALSELTDLPFIWANKAASLQSDRAFNSENTSDTLDCLKLAWATHNVPYVGNIT